MIRRFFPLWLALTVPAVPLAVASGVLAAEESQARGDVKLLLDRQYEALYEQFDPAMQRALPVEKLRALFDPERSARGPLKGIQPLSNENKRGFQVYQLEATFEQGLPLVFTLTLRPDGKLVGLFFKNGTGQVDQAALEKAIAFSKAG